MVLLRNYLWILFFSFCCNQLQLHAQGQCLVGGCTGGSQYPSSTLSSNTNSWTVVSTLSWAGEYAIYNVTSGSTYEWSLLAADGGSASYDAQLTLLNGTGTTILCFSDDYAALLPKIQWTATFTGTVRVLLNAYSAGDCMTNSISTTVVWRCSSCGAGSAPANDNCSGAATLTVDAAAVGGTVTGATNSLTAGCAGTSEDDVWYKFTTSTAGYYTITGISSASFDAVVDLRSGACNGTNMVCADNSNSGGTEIITVSLAATTTYYVRVYDYSSTPPATLTFTVQVTKPATCTPYTTYGTTSGDYIDNVTLSAINNTTGAGSYYTDYYSTISTSLQAGTNQNLVVTVGTYGGQTLAAWIDYNADGDFSDAGESLGEIANIAASIASTFNFTIPSGTAVGLKRMRVRTVWSTTTLDPCATYSYGEAEDYKINITAACVTPGSPITLSTSGITASQAQVNWVAGAPAGSATVTYYWAIGSASTVTYEANYLFRGTTTSLNAVQASLSEGLTYYWTVKAVTSCNNTASAYPAAISFKACTTPGTPTLNAPTVNSSDATLSWTANATAGSPTVTYKWAIGAASNVTYEANYSQRGITTDPTTTALVTGLTGNTVYYYTVKAESGCNSLASAYPAAGNFTTTCQIPGTPTSMATTTITNTSATLNWAAGTPTGSPTVTYYWAVGTASNVTYEANNLGAGYIGTTTSTSVSLPATGLTAGVTYYWVVKAKSSCSATPSAYPTALPFTTIPLTPLYVWTGATSSEWNLAANWNPNTGYPAVTDHVIIPNVSAGSNRYPILTTASLCVNTTTTAYRCLSLTIDANARVTVDAALLGVECAGVVNISGVLNHQAGSNSDKFQVLTGGVVTVKSGGFLNIGSSALSGVTSGTPAGTVNAFNDIQINAGQLIVETGGTVYIQDELRLLASTSSKFRQEGGLVSVAMSGQGSTTRDKVSVATTAVFRIINGTFRVSGDGDGIATTYDAIWFSATSTIDIQGGTIELLNGTTSSIFTLSIANTSTVFKNILVNKSGQTVYLDGNDISVAGDMTLSSGTLNANGFNISLAGNLSNNGGTFTGGAGTLTLTGNGKTIDGSAAGAFSNLTMNSGSNYTFNPSYGTAPQAAVSGVFTFNTGANLTLSSGKAIELNGASTILNGTLNATNYDGTGDIRFNNTAVGLTGTGAINADLQVTSGTTTLGSNFTFNGDMLLNTGTLDLSSRTLTLAGNFTNNGTLTASTGTVTFTGNGKLINGSSASVFNIVNFNSGSGYSINPSSVAIPCLTFNGNLTIGSNATLTLATTKIISIAGAANTISGTLTAVDKLDGTRDIGLNNVGGTLACTGNLNADIQVSSGLTTLTTNMLLNGDFFANTGTFVMTSHTLTLNGSWTNNGTFTHGTGTIIFAGTSKNITGSAVDGANSWLNNVIIQSGASYNFNPTVATNWDIDGSFQNYGTLTIASGKFLDIYATTAGGENIILDGTITATSVFDGTRDIDINSTVGLTGSGTTNADLRIYGGTTTLASNFTLNGDFVIRTTATFTMSTHTFSAGGSWTNSGAFTSGTGTVKFTGSVSSTLNANGYYDGTNKATADFYNVIIDRGTDTLSMYSTPMHVLNNFDLSNGIFSTGWKTQSTGTNGGNRRLTVERAATIGTTGTLFVGYWKACGAGGENLPCGTSDSLNVPVFKGDLTNYGWVKTNRPLKSGFSDLKLTGARITGTGTTNEFGVDIQPEDGTTATQVGPVYIQGDLIIQDPAANKWENTDPNNVLTIGGSLYIYGSFVHNGTVNVYRNMTSSVNVSNTVTINNSIFNFYNDAGTLRYIYMDKDPINFGTLTFNGAITRDLRQNITVSGNLTIESPCIVDAYRPINFPVAGAAASTNIALSGPTSSWTNNGTFTPETGTVSFTGSGAQAMGGSSNTTFYNLTVAKTGGTDLTFGNSADVSNQLNLTSGFVVTTASKLLSIDDQAAVSPSGGASTSYVKGPVKKIGRDGVAGPYSFLFPTGKNSIWGKLNMVHYGGTTAATDAFTAEYNNFQYPVTTVTSPLNHVSTQEHWTLTKNSGNANLNKRLRLYSENNAWSGITAYNDTNLTVAHFNSGTGKWEDIGYASNGSNSGAGTPAGWISSEFTGNFSPFTFASRSKTHSLPIELLSFTAKPNGNNVDVFWSTSSEINNDYFNVERSIDLNTFETIATVKGAGNSNQLLNYSGIDKNPIIGVSYYRLKQVDYDGNFTYSQIVPISIQDFASSDPEKEGITKLVVYPNPTTGIINVSFDNLKEEKYQMIILDMFGKQLQSSEKIVNEGNVLLQFDLQGLPQGVYLLVLQTSTKRYSQKLIVQY